MEIIGDAASVELHASRKRKTNEEAAIDGLDDDDEEDLEDEEEGVTPVVVMKGSKHGDGSLYQPKVDALHWLFKLQLTTETSMQPMWLTLPTTECQPTSTASCGRHVGGPMLQIFSVKLAKLPRASSSSSPAAAAAAGPIELYGFMAVRDLMDPLRNYVFNRGRDDPYVIPDLHSDPFVYISGPRRGVSMQARVLFEYDVRIKKGGGGAGDESYKDLPLIDGVAVFSERTCVDEPAPHRIRGGGGAAVDVGWARLTRAMEATVQVWVHELAPPPQQQQQKHGGGGGLDLRVSGFVGKIAEEIRLFRGVVDKPCALDRFLVAVSVDSDLILHFKAAAAGGGGGSASQHVGEFAFRCAAHGSISDCRKFDFATVEVKVTWSPLY